MNQRVLCVSSGAVSRLYHSNPAGWFCSEPDELEDFRKLVQARSYFIARDRAEQDDGYVQLISYCVIANKSRLLCVERSAESARAELKSKWTSMFGGHVDEEDKTENGWQTVISGVKREIKEELGIHINGHTPQFAGLAIDPTNQTGRLHIGVIFCYSIAEKGVRLTEDLDLAEFNVIKNGIVHFFSRRELLPIQDQFDPWSTLFLQSNFLREFLHADMYDSDDLPLLRSAKVY
jgi:predicted NUDIX family phosphoesterase